MYTFYNKSCQYYLSSNTKVLTSTLRASEQLRFASRKKEVIHALKKRFGLKALPHYVLSRDPYKRTESFFKEKLRQKVKAVFDKDIPYKLKLHQEIFYPLAGIEAQMSLQEKVGRLLAISFNAYVRYLPKVYMKDVHLRPQSNIAYQKVKGVFPHRLTFDRVIKIENDADMQFLNDSLGINTSIKVNRSKDTKQEVEWMPELLQIVNKLYSRDFEMFHYSMRNE